MIHSHLNVLCTIDKGGVSQSVPSQSLVSNRKTSTVVSDTRAGKHHGSSGGKTGANLAGHGGESNSQVILVTVVSVLSVS